MSQSTQKRVVFDFALTFTNGGGMQGQGFRLDIEDDDISDRVLADYIVRDMRLLMVGEVEILNKQVITEPHKRRAMAPRSEESVRVDLSHTVTDGLVTYKGLPAPIICDYLSREASRGLYSDGTEFQIGKIEMVTNTGTYIDFPFHRYADGKDSSQIELQHLVDLPAIVIRVPYHTTKAVDRAAFENHELRNRAVLVHTGWDVHWNSEHYFEQPPYLTEAAARYLQQCGVRLVGIDSLNIDNIEDKGRPVHSILLGSDILIVEHLCNLNALPDEELTFTAVPPKFHGVGTFPVRAFATFRQTGQAAE